MPPRTRIYRRRRPEPTVGKCADRAVLGDRLEGVLEAVCGHRPGNREARLWYGGLRGEPLKRFEDRRYVRHSPAVWHASATPLRRSRCTADVGARQRAGGKPRRSAWMLCLAGVSVKMASPEDRYLQSRRPKSASGVRESLQVPVSHPGPLYTR